MAVNSDMISSDKILDTLIPGYTLFAQALSHYFSIDISRYSIHILFLSALFTSLLFWGPAIISQARSIFLSCAISVEINYNDPLFRQVLQWISKNPQLSQTRHSIAGIRNRPSNPSDDDDDQDDSESESEYGDGDEVEDKVEGRDTKNNLSPDSPLKFTHKFWQYLSFMARKKPIHRTPAHGEYHSFRYKGCWIALHRMRNQIQSQYQSPNAETIRFYTAQWNRKIFQELLDEVQEEFLEHEINRITIHRAQVYRGSDAYWRAFSSMYPRSLSTVILDGDKKAAVVNDVKQFIHPETRSWYRNRCFPYRRGYLFYGPPGTGKSSMCLALASLLRFDIYTINFGSRSLTEDGLSTLLQDLPSRCILLLEDVDTSGIGKRDLREDKHDDDSDDEGTESRNRISLSALLNGIDGVGAKEGRILVMTTNDRGKIDAALLRPGRVDMEVRFGFADQATIRRLFLAFYGLTDDNNQDTQEDLTAGDGASRAEIDSLSVEFAKLIPSEKFSPADIQNYLFPHRDSPKAALRGAHAWVIAKQDAYKQNQK